MVASESRDWIYEAQVGGPDTGRGRASAGAPVGSASRPRGSDILGSWDCTTATKRKLLARLYTATPRKRRGLSKRPVERGARAPLLARLGRRLGDPRLVREGPYRTTLWLAGDCERPISRELVGRSPFPASVTIDGKGCWDGWSAGDTPHHFHTDVVRCRKCTSCLRMRQMEWFARGSREAEGCFAAGCQPYLVTLTVEPRWREISEQDARARAIEDGLDWAGLTDGEQFKSIVKYFRKGLAKYVRDMRRQCGLHFRYLLVPEPHPSSGFPHFHAILYPLVRVRPFYVEESSKQTWPYGFVKVRPCRDSRAAGYVAKYLGKESAARIGASPYFGNFPWALHATLYSIASRDACGTEAALLNTNSVIGTVLKEQRAKTAQEPVQCSAVDREERRNRRVAAQTINSGCTRQVEPRSALEESMGSTVVGEDWLAGLDPCDVGVCRLYYRQIRRYLPAKLAYRYGVSLARARARTRRERLASAAKAASRSA